MQARGTTHLWLAGAGLLIAWMLVVAAASGALATCGTDCGDNGGRAAFIGLIAGAPLGALAVTLFVLAAGGERGPLKLLSKLAIAGGAMIGLVVVVLVVIGVGGVIRLIAGHDTVDHAVAKGTWACFVLALVVLPIAATGLLPSLAAKGGDSSYYARYVLGALGLVYVTVTVLSLGNPDLFPYLLVGAATTAGAALTFRELARRTP